MLAITDAANTTQPAPLTHTRRRLSKRTAMSHLLTIQEELMRDILNPETPAHWRSMAARAWNDCEERKRILRGIPLPGQMRPDLKPMKHIVVDTGLVK